MDDATTERIAREFHEVYERLAPEHGWKSQTPVAWDHLPLNNKLLMLAVVRELPWIKEQALKLDTVTKERDEHGRALSTLSMALNSPALEFGDDKTLSDALVAFAVMQIENYKDGWSKCDDAWAKEVEELESRLATAEKVRDLAVKGEGELMDVIRRLESRLGTVEQLLRDTMRPHGSCTEGSCTHCDATSALADMARALVGEKRPHIDIPAPDCPCTGCEVLRRDAAVERHEPITHQFGRHKEGCAVIAIDWEGKCFGCGVQIYRPERDEE